MGVALVRNLNMQGSTRHASLTGELSAEQQATLQTKEPTPLKRSFKSEKLMEMQNKWKLP